MPKRFNGIVNLDVGDSVQTGVPSGSSQPSECTQCLDHLVRRHRTGRWSPYGGRIDMPTMQRPADDGLTYTQWAQSMRTSSSIIRRFWEVFGLGEAQLFPTISDAIEAHLDQSDGSTE